MRAPQDGRCHAGEVLLVELVGNAAGLQRFRVFTVDGNTRVGGWGSTRRVCGLQCRRFWRKRVGTGRNPPGPPSPAAGAAVRL